MTVTTTTFAGNHAIAHGGEEAISTEQFGGVAEGGGLWVEEAALNVSSSKFENNEAQAIGGPGAHGGITEGGGLWVDGAMTVTATTFTGNALDSRGGQGLSSPDQKGGVAEGGGLWAAHEEPGAAIVGGSSFKYNRIDASGGFGGAGGIAEGGAVWDVPEENVTFSLSRSTVALNSIRNGGIGSSGTSEGGGIWVVTEDEASAALVGTTLAENEIDAPGEAPGVSAGGNLYSTGTVSVADSIISGGIGAAGTSNCSDPVATSRGFNIDSGDECGFHAGGDRINTSPKLGPMQDNGGPTETMALPLNSPAVDQGSTFGLSADQRGIARPIDLPAIPNSAAPGADGSDIGAYELQPTNQFSLDALRRNKKKGTATISVGLNIPSGGTLVLTGKGLKRQTVTVTGLKTSLKMKVIPTGKARKALSRKKGKRKVNRRKVRISVTYSPPGNSARTIPRKATLVRKKPRHRKKSRHEHSG